MSRESPSEYSSFGDVSRGRLNQQSQYGSRYVGGRHGYPDLSQGLRFLGSPTDYHGLQIHKGDIEEFVARVEFWKVRGLMPDSA